MTALWAVARKEWHTLVRDPAGLVMLFVLPAIFIVTLSLALQGAFSSTRKEDRIRVAILPGASAASAEADALRTALDESILFQVASSRPSSREEGLAGLVDRRWDVLVVLPPTLDAAARFDAAARIELVVDSVMSPEVAHAAEATVRSIVEGRGLSELGRRLEEIAVRARALGYTVPERSVDGKQTGLEVTLSYAPSRGDRIRVNSVQQNVPGWTVFALFWIAQVLALNLLDERSSGAHLRIRCAPVSRLAYLVGKMVPFACVNVVQAAVLFGVGVTVLPLFGAPGLVLSSPLALFVLTVAISAAALSFGLLLSSLSRSAVLVASLSAALLVIMTVIGGIMVPKYVMPGSMQRLAHAVPQGWALDGYLKILVRGADLSELGPELGALGAFAMTFTVVALARLRTLER